MENAIRDHAYFLSFCIEQYKEAKGLTGKETMQVLAKYGVLQYLEACFDVLHTQSRQWLIEEMDEYIENQNRKEVPC